MTRLPIGLRVLACVIACAALLLVGPGARADDERAEPLDAARVAKDLETARAIRDLAKSGPDEKHPWTLERLLEQLGDHEERQSLDLGYGGRRLDLSRHGGYADAWIETLGFAGRVVALRITFRASERADRELAQHFTEILGKRYRRTDGAFETSWDSSAALVTWRKAVRKALGEPPDAAVPAKFAERMETLLSPWEEHVVGKSFGLRGSEPKAHEAIRTFVEAERFDLVGVALRSVSPEVRIVAAQALIERQSAGAELSLADARAIALLRESDLPVRTCAGCEVSSRPGRDVLNDANRDD